ncbi:MAG: magnesium transporter [Actinobacteria bacterium]|nr:magnesium transporter [Actinomycetota bacterium]MBU1945025.1 magnesium transporter [Actinomycetota bacterium]MBU2686639.1 magnesium transporter [Actinomycetota bacterium]
MSVVRPVTREAPGGYPEESIGSIMSIDVLKALGTDSLRDILHVIADRSWDDVQYVYVTDRDEKLTGVVDLSAFAKADLSVHLEELMEKPRVTVRPESDQETAVVQAIKHDVTAVPVVDDDHRFIGAVTPRKIIDVMHQEHLEDALLASGIRGRGSHILRLATSRYREVLFSRAPWLIFGAVVGLGLGLLASLFERTLQETVALAFFIPVVAYIADSVGTQAEAITVRALATLNIKSRMYMMRELIIGLLLGVMLGALGWVGALLISRSFDIAMVVGLSLFAASTIASVLASLIPITLKAMHVDPALGAGPIATALQDVISVLIYFLFAMALL